ncbi:glutamate 5-kinase [Tuwongella immobilis]|uniref:Glutamate 5-kinase n=1 Tax=Tuwongella immobilis TaxID=692036 RepID=A0A6C2YKJ5_9BACT|nr:glutamate 5-kinase [Tuwongella immobilis]VIP02100.1 glutamate 5-kinase : Glutamate 5-kinase OS=Planctomyces maris DSM 8797 GN=proB PE=3 SV=1: AA_kinase: PUA [Tuwongella immobilis]VTS00386.1 glutamate 5-kinase : Glutamate 5-kinase OS=Planctomyces maris DSM 8797 GN=proB PE=3 SV=1: AA_kinase: PUA [Tuwongella immobilis]
MTRQAILEAAQTIVVKVGTNVLCDPNGTLDRTRMQALTDQLVRIRQTGRRVALVSSGAVGAGMGRLGLAKRPSELPELQACAAIGQAALMQMYQECLAPSGVQSAQILLTASDFDNRTRYLNARHTIRTLLEWNCLPIINENDTISTAEIRFGDNDQLAAMVTNLLQAELLILLTVVDGLYSADPNTDPTARILTTVPTIDRSVTELAGATRSTLGTGGMGSKLRAARLATNAGEAVIMANGAKPGVIDAIMGGAEVGTLFLPHGENMAAWKRWLGYTAQPRGSLTLDAGAVTAVVQKGRSLLPIGVRQVSGDFDEGDVVSLRQEDGREIARGLCNYDHRDAALIVGQKREQIVTILGRVPYDEMIHRDNLVVLG